ncbi:MAG: TRAP transporter small permease [Desulfatiglandales bacterium]
MNALNALKEWIQRLTLYVSYLGMVLLIPMMLLTTTDVMGRALWSRPIYGTVELSSYMLAIFILLGIAYTHQVKGHVRVTMLTSRLPRRANLALDLVTILLSMFIIGLIAWQGWVVGMEERAVSDMLRVPQRPFKLLVSVAAFLLWLELCIDLFATIKQLSREE